MRDNERIAKRAVEIAEELRKALPPNTDFGEGWQRRYLDRQNERYEKALEMARAEVAELGWKTPELTEGQWHEAAAEAKADRGTVASRAPDICGLDEQDIRDGVQASPVKWCPECRSAGVVGIEQDECPTCDGTGKVVSGPALGEGGKP